MLRRKKKTYIQRSLIADVKSELAKRDCDSLKAAMIARNVKSNAKVAEAKGNLPLTTTATFTVTTMIGGKPFKERETVSIMVTASSVTVS